MAKEKYTSKAGIKKAINSLKEKYEKAPKKKVSAKTAAAFKEGRKKGDEIRKRAMEIMRKAGKKTVTKEVYKMTLGDAMKKAAKQV